MRAYEKIGIGKREPNDPFRKVLTPQSPIESDDDLPRSLSISVLAIVNPLPLSQRKVSVFNWNRDRVSDQDALRVSRHIIWTLAAVGVINAIFRDDSVQNRLHVRADRRIPILVQSQTG